MKSGCKWYKIVSEELFYREGMGMKKYSGILISVLLSLSLAVTGGFPDIFIRKAAASSGMRDITAGEIVAEMGLGSGGITGEALRSEKMKSIKRVD